MKMTMKELKEIIKDVIEEVQLENEEIPEDEELDLTDEQADEEDVENTDFEGDELPLEDEDAGSDESEEDEDEVEEAVDPKQLLNEDVDETFADEYVYYINGEEVDEATFEEALRDEIASDFEGDEEILDDEFNNTMIYFENVAKDNLPEDIYPQVYGGQEFQMLLK